MSYHQYVKTRRKDVRFHTQLRVDCIEMAYSVRILLFTDKINIGRKQ